MCLGRAWPCRWTEAVRGTGCALAATVAVADADAEAEARAGCDWWMGDSVEERSIHPFHERTSCLRGHGHGAGG